MGIQHGDSDDLGCYFSLLSSAGQLPSLSYLTGSLHYLISKFSRRQNLEFYQITFPEYINWMFSPQIFQLLRKVLRTSR